MKTRNWWAPGLIVWMLASGAIFAQGVPDKAKSPGAADKTKKAKPFQLVKKADGTPLLSYELTKVAQALRLDEAQQRLVADSVEVANLRAADWKKANEPKLKELEAQRDKLYEQIKALNSEYSRLRAARHTKVAEVLTADQMEKWIRHQLGEPMQYYSTNYKFTEEQTKKAKALEDAAVQQILSAPKEQRAALIEKISDDLRHAVRDLVTLEQRQRRYARSAMYYVTSHLRGVELTKEQEGQMQALVADEIKAAAEKAERVRQLYQELEKLRKESSTGSSSFYRALADKVKKTILTDPQRAALSGRRRRE